MNGKSIYQPSGKAREYAKWACNFYVGCSNLCDYCYCKKGILNGTMGGDKPTLKKCFMDEAHAYEIFEKELKANLPELQKHGLFFSFTTDPMLPETIGMTAAALDLAVTSGVPVKILTKCADFADPDVVIPELEGFPYNIEPEYRNLIAFGFTLTGHDELEPYASPNTERIKAMRMLHEAGFKTFASIEPIVDFPSAKRMISEVLGFCDLYKVGLMAGKKYDVSEAQTFVEWLDDNFPNNKIYLKESIRKITHYTQGDLGDNFVDADYEPIKT